MSWNKVYYGVEKPTKLKKLALHALMLSSFFFFYGWWADFIPNSSLQKYGNYSALIFSFTLSIWFFTGLYSGKLKINNTKSKIIKTSAVASSPFLFYWVFWLSIVHGVPALWTRALGDNHSVEVTLQKENKHSRHSCDYRYIGQALENAFPSYICLDKISFRTLPKNIPVKMSGYQSFLG